jgi:hypothetical protein
VKHHSLLIRILTLISVKPDGGQCVRGLSHANVRPNFLTFNLLKAHYKSYVQAACQACFRDNAANGSDNTFSKPTLTRGYNCGDDDLQLTPMACVMKPKGEMHRRWT